MWSPLPASKPEWLLSAAQQCPCERLRLALRVHVEVRRPDPRCPAALGAASPDHISPARPADAACCSGSRHDHHTAYLARSRRGSGALTRPNFPTAGGRGRCGREDRTGGRRAAGRAQQPERPVLPAHRHLVRCPRSCPCCCCMLCERPPAALPAVACPPPATLPLPAWPGAH